MALFKRQKPKKKAIHKKQQRPTSQTTALASPKLPVSMPVFEPKSFVPSGSFTPPMGQTVPRDWAKKKSVASKAKFDPEKEFLKTFKELTSRHRGWDIWNDFIVMAACALSNPVDKERYEEREARYLRIINKYNKTEQRKFPDLFAYTVLALELNPEQDFLGKLYTSLNLQDEGRKQHFTPYSVCQLMAEVTIDKVVEQVQENGYITINDPCCGAGATLIAAIHSAKRHLAEAGLNFQNHILVTTQDIDETVALMCYIQLSLLGVAAYIKVGNALTDPMSTSDTNENYWFTPIYFSDVWSMRRLVHKLDKLFQPSNSELKKKPFRLFSTT